MQMSLLVSSQVDVNDEFGILPEGKSLSPNSTHVLQVISKKVKTKVTSPDLDRKSLRIPRVKSEIDLDPDFRPPRTRKHAPETPKCEGKYVITPIFTFP
jgi:hypothetical protein